jgi:hypothetical protein
MERCIRAELADCTDSKTLADVSLFDPPFLNSLTRRLTQMAPEEPVAYAHVVVDHIRIDSQDGCTSLSRMERGTLVTIRLPCIVAVTTEHIREKAGPYIVTISRRGKSVECPVFHGYARQIMSKRSGTPIDAIAERETGRDLLMWAGNVARCGVQVKIIKPLVFSTDLNGQRYIADFEVWVKGNNRWHLAFIEVSANVGRSYWLAKVGPQAAMAACGTLILDDRSDGMKSLAKGKLMAQLHRWLNSCLS